MTRPTEIFGGIAVLLNLSTAIPYFVGVYKKTNKPHFITWLIWTLSTLVVFIAQLVSNAGPGAWMSFVGICTCGAAMIVGLICGEKTITRGDWICLILTLLAILLWFFTHNPFYAVILITLIDVIGYYPTFRKSWSKPDEEPALPYALGTVGRLFGIAALSSFQPVNWIYNVAVIAANSSLIVWLMMRRAAKPSLRP